MSRIGRYVALALVGLSLAVGACGKKPSDVTAPQGEENDTFPNTYPKT